MASPFVEQNLVSFDGSHSELSRVFYPDRYRTLENLFKETGPFSVMGAGLSYPALSFGSGSRVIDMSHWRRILAFDGKLGTIEVEAGMTLGELAVFGIEHGWFLKVQPGHPSISLGGCLGADVHGKNQKSDGNFKDQVLFLRLYHPDKGFIHCSPTENSELFDLTCGGWGLTGVVVSIGLKLGAIQSTFISSETIPNDNFTGLFERLESLAGKYELLYTWHDCNDFDNWGRGFIKTGRFADHHETVESTSAVEDFISLKANERGRFPGFNLMNPLSIRAMNFAFKRLESRGMNPRHESLLSFLFPVAKKTFYFDLFGRVGFHESQVLFSKDAFEPAMRELKSGIQKHRLPVTVASCKLFNGKQSLLRFNGAGIVMAINFPRCIASLEFLKWWDGVIREHKGLPSLVKDSRLPIEMVRSCYPEYDKFKSAIERWDPKRTFKNSLSQRLQL